MKKRIDKIMRLANENKTQVIAVGSYNSASEYNSTYQNPEPEKVFHTLTVSQDHVEITTTSSSFTNEDFPVTDDSDMQFLASNNTVSYQANLSPEVALDSCIIELEDQQRIFTQQNNSDSIPIETIYESDKENIQPGITDLNLLIGFDLFPPSGVKSDVMPTQLPEQNSLLYTHSNGNNNCSQQSSIHSNEEVIETTDKLEETNGHSDTEIVVHSDDVGFTKKGISRKRKMKQTNESKSEKERKKFAADKEKHELKPSCSANTCKRLRSTKITAARRQRINEEFWMQDWTTRRSFVLHTTKKCDVKRRTTNELGGKSRRNNTINFYMKNEKGDTLQVCKTFYLTTLGSNSHNDAIIKLVSNSSALTVEKDKRGLHPKHKKIDRQAIHDHIQKYHPCASHYRREHAPNKLYLPSDISIRMMHSDFVENNPNCSYELYRRVLVKEENISFAHLGHEECEICESHKLHDSSHTKEKLNPQCDTCKVWDTHIKRAQIARQMYRDDAQKGNDSQEVYFSGDLQKVIMLPRLEMFKTAIFSQRIIAFNESFVPADKNSQENPFAVLWHEATAGRKKEEIISAFFQFFIHHRDKKHIVLWLDNCTGQNKNWALFSFLVYLINSDYVSTELITLKYFEPGHTFMSADSFHHQVEAALKKKKKVYDFRDFEDAVASGNSGKVIIKPMEFSDFYHWKDYSSSKLRPKVYVSDLVQVVAKRGSFCLEYKNSFSDGDCKQLSFLKGSITRNRHQMTHPEQYSRSRGIPVSKRESILRNLSKLMPADRLRFWENIPVSDESNDSVGTFE